MRTRRGIREGFEKGKNRNGIIIISKNKKNTQKRNLKMKKTNSPS